MEIHGWLSRFSEGRLFWNTWPRAQVWWASSSSSYKAGRGSLTSSLSPGTWLTSGLFLKLHSMDGANLLSYVLPVWQGRQKCSLRIRKQCEYVFSVELLLRPEKPFLAIPYPQICLAGSNFCWMQANISHTISIIFNMNFDTYQVYCSMKFK